MRSSAHTFALAGAVAALACVVYLPVLGFEFVNYDDVVYVTENPRVADGLRIDGVFWSLTAFVNGNWHPVTLLSHMLDVSLFGLRPAGHHATSVLLHAACAAALLLLLARATGQLWPSAAAAALFAVHPLNVESVAWIAERKNPLSTLLWLLSLLAWVSYSRSPRRVAYLAALACAALAVASKPMAVTLPFTLLILDVWPLKDAPGVRGASRVRRWIELAPFFGLSLACGILTLQAQAASRALQSLEAYPLLVRLLAVPVGTAWYLSKGIWPAELAVFYPHPHATGSAIVAAASAILVGTITVVAWALRRRSPALAAGWAWYLVTRAPVAGIVQVGSQAYADRYAYVPLLGIFAALAWAVFPSPGPRPGWKATAAAVAAAACVVALALVTRGQLAHWKDSITLFDRALTVVPDSALAWNNLGMAYVERGRTSESVDCFRRAVSFAPWDTDARSNLGSALTVQGRPAEAVAEFEKAIEQAPGDATIRFNLAKALDDLGRPAEAEQRLKEAMAADPAYARAPLYLGILYHRARRLDEAVPLLERSVALDPRSVEGYLALGAARAARGDGAGALQSFEEALRLDPSNAGAAEAVRRLRARISR